MTPQGVSEMRVFKCLWFLFCSSCLWCSSSRSSYNKKIQKKRYKQKWICSLSLILEGSTDASQFILSSPECRWWQIGAYAVWGGSRSKIWPTRAKPSPLIENKSCWFYFTERNKSKNKGLISADRRTKPTLMLTIPHSYKVVYNGFISSNVWNCDKIRCWARRPTRMRVTSEKDITSLSSMDSDLEAFSHNPTDDSFAALAVQLTAWTNYLN